MSAQNDAQSNSMNLLTFKKVAIFRDIFLIENRFYKKILYRLWEEKFVTKFTDQDLRENLLYIMYMWFTEYLDLFVNCA